MRAWILFAVALGGCLTDAGVGGETTPGAAGPAPAAPDGPTQGLDTVGPSGTADAGAQPGGSGTPGIPPDALQPGAPRVGSPTETDLVPAPEPASRSRRRMDLDQLSQAIEQATGGVRWTEMKNGEPVDLFQQLGPTLGRPDYLEQVSEDLEPTALFQKFLSDAARSVCYELVERDLSVFPPQRVLMRHVDPADTIETNPTGVDANLRVLLMRFHGRDTSPQSPGLVPWRWLFTSSTHVSGDPVAGWRTVCVGLITHPDFYSY